MTDIQMKQGVKYRRRDGEVFTQEKDKSGLSANWFGSDGWARRDNGKHFGVMESVDAVEVVHDPEIHDPPPLKDMTDAEIGEIMRAFWAGEKLQVWGKLGRRWKDKTHADVEPLKYYTYRVKPKPEVRCAAIMLDGKALGHMDVIDGEVDPATFRKAGEE